MEGYDDAEKFYLIDFGLAEEFRDKNGVHREKIKTNRFQGNFMFCSLNNCRTYTKSRKDDFESLLNILLYLTSDFKLPWESIKIGKSAKDMGLSLALRL